MTRPTRPTRPTGRRDRQRAAYARWVAVTRRDVDRRVIGRTSCGRLREDRPWASAACWWSGQASRLDSGLLPGAERDHHTVVERAGEQRSVAARWTSRPGAEGGRADAPARTDPRRGHPDDRLAAVTGGRTIGWIPIQAGPDAIEIPRSELPASGVAACEYAEFAYDDTVTAIRADDQGVEVSFERAVPALRSGGGAEDCTRRCGGSPLDRRSSSPATSAFISLRSRGCVASDLHTVLIHNAPGRAVAIHLINGREGVASSSDTCSVRCRRKGRGEAEAPAQHDQPRHGMAGPELLDRAAPSTTCRSTTCISTPSGSGWTLVAGSGRADRGAADRVSAGEGSSMACRSSALLSNCCSHGYPAALQHTSVPTADGSGPTTAGLDRRSLPGTGDPARPGSAPRGVRCRRHRRRVLERIRPRPPAP